MKIGVLGSYFFSRNKRDTRQRPHHLRRSGEVFVRAMPLPSIRGA